MRWIIRLFALLVLIATVIVVSVLMLPGERIARIAADQIEQATGRAVAMSGETKVSFYPVLGISTGPTTVANADWSDAGPMMQADSFKVGVEPSALFGGAIRITGLEAVNPRIVLERARDGRVNWELGVEGVVPSGQSDGAAPAESSQLSLTLDRALITGASLRYIDHGAGTTIAYENMDFDLRWPSYTGEASFDVVVRPAGEDIRVTGTIARLDQLIEGAVSEINAVARTKGGEATFAGRARSLPQLDGVLKLRLDNTSAFLASLGQAAVDLPEGLGRAVTLDGRATLSESGRVSLRDMVLTLDQNRITGGVDVISGGARPRIEAKLSAGALDLTALDTDSGGESGGSGGGTAVETGWSRAPIDASALGLADAEVAIAAESLDLGTFKFGKTRVVTTVDRARAVFSLQELNGYGGVVSGQFVANNRNGLSVGGDMTARDMDMERLLTDAAGITRFATRGDASLKFLGVGPSVDAIMNSLSGSLSVSSGRGVISGFDLDKLMRTGDGSGGTTVFDAMSASFAIQDGNMTGDDLRMSMPLAKATGKGRIGLGAQDINYTFTPSLLEGESRKGLAIPVRIKGPWRDPKIYPDLEEAIDLNFKEETKKLKEDARKEAEDFVAKELGVKPEEGQSLEDAVMKEVEDAVMDELFKLFD